MHFSNRDGNCNFLTYLACGLHTSTHVPHSTTAGGSSNDRVYTYAFRNTWKVPPDACEILPSHQATYSPWGSHFRFIACATLSKEASACFI